MSLCSSDNDNKSDAEIPFEEVDLNLSNLSLQQSDTSFIVSGFTFTNQGAESSEFPTTSTLNGQSIEFKGITLWFDGMVFRYIELELDDTMGLSKITTRVFNNGITGTVALYNNGNLVEEIESPSLVSDITMNVTGREFDKLRISSPEGQAISISLE